MGRNDIFGGAPPPDIAQWAEPLRTTAARGSIPRAAQVPPFWQFKPPSGSDLYSFGVGTLAAGAGSTVDLTFTSSWSILTGYEGVLQSLTVGVSAPLVTLDIFFTLLGNGAPIIGWDRLTPQPVAANAIIIPFSGPLQLPERTLLSVRVTNNAASGPWTVNATIAGWQWPRIVRQQTFGED